MKFGFSIPTRGPVSDRASVIAIARRGEALRLDLSRRFLDRLPGTPAGHDVGAGLRQAESQSPTDAGRAAHHDGELACQIKSGVSHHRPPNLGTSRSFVADSGPRPFETYKA